jgi:hypothetical protein
MENKLAVLLVHGILNNDEKDFADTGIRLLKTAFSSATGVAADEALVIKPAPWGKIIQPYEDRLLTRLGGERGTWLYNWLNRVADKIDAGSITALAGAGLSMLARTLPWGPTLHYPALRWIVDQYIGDFVAYQITPAGRELYDGVHTVLAQTLGELATEAGPDAPLFVLSHSLGTVISSDFFYDRQREAGLFGGQADTQAATPLERGETLASLYTMGSVIALCTLRFSDDELNRPVIVPDPRLATHHPRVSGHWTNIYDPDDVVASALSTLGAHYANALTDERRSVGPTLLNTTPLSHLGYWNDRAVMTSIGQAMAQTWRELAADQPVHAQSATLNG